MIKPLTARPVPLVNVVISFSVIPIIGYFPKPTPEASMANRTNHRYLAETPMAIRVLILCSNLLYSRLATMPKPSPLG
ncbi:MAG: hypothetical protein NTW48_02290 [Chloroflexi bacterium]|nr:hypothetical protein [Chloroflexota bacterium]